MCISLFDKDQGRLGVAAYPLNRSVQDRNFVTQSHSAQMYAPTQALHAALDAKPHNGEIVKVLVIDAIGSSVIPVDEKLHQSV